MFRRLLLLGWLKGRSFLDTNSTAGRPLHRCVRTSGNIYLVVVRRGRGAAPHAVISGFG